jgi:hypothetical protein
MAQLTVNKIIGEVIATSHDGVFRTLKLGDIIKDGETIVTKNGATITFVDDLGAAVIVSENQTLRSSPEIFTTAPPTAQDSAVMSDTSDAVITALNRGEDLSTTLEATAAGSSEVTDSGSSFVQLLRIVEGVDPIQYNYEYAAPDLLPDLVGTGEQLAMLEEVDPTLPPGGPEEPPVEPKEPRIVITKEYKTETTVETKTETFISDEYETDRDVTTAVTEENQNNGTLTTTTTTTVISYNKETNTITTTTTTTTTYVRDVTTTTTEDGVTVVNGEWTVDNVDTDVVTDTVVTNTPREETVVDIDTEFVADPPDDDNGNNGHGNNEDGQDDDNPGQGGGGPNEDPKDGDDEDEGDIGNQGDDTPGVGNNDEPLVDDIDPIPPLLPPEDEDLTPGNSGQDNGHGNNIDGQDDNNPGKGSGGPNLEYKDLTDEDEGLIGNHGDISPGSRQSVGDDLSWNLSSNNLYISTKSDSDF